MVSLAGHSAGDEWRRRLDRPVAVGGVDVGVAQPRGLDPDDDLALTGDRLGNLLDDERPCEVLDDRGPHRLRRRPWTRPLLLNAGHRSLLRPVSPAFRRPAAQTSGCPPIRCGRLPTPARVSDTSDVTGSALSRPWSTRLAPPIPLTPDLGMTTGQLNRWALNQWWKVRVLVTSSRVSPSLASRATRPARGLL